MLKNLLNGMALFFSILCAPNLSGAEEGAVRDIDLLTGNVNYRLACSVFKKDGKEYLSGIGLLGCAQGSAYSKRGWSAEGFMQLAIGGENLFRYPVVIKADVKTCELSFDTPGGNVAVVFRVEEQGRMLFTTIKMPGKGKLDCVLTAYPGEFNRQNLSLNQRHAATTLRDMVFPGEEKIGEEEMWIYFYDKKNNPAGIPHRSTCAVLWNPKETDKVKVKGKGANSYAVLVELQHKEGLREVHYIFWEFPGEDHFKALEYMKNLKIEYVR